MSKKKEKQLDDARVKVVLSEIVDMYAENGGIMPSSRQIKKNRYISEEEVSILRKMGKTNEDYIRKLAQEKTGRTFMTRQENTAHLLRGTTKKRTKEKEQKKEQEQEQKIQLDITELAREIAGMAATSDNAQKEDIVTEEVTPEVETNAEEVTEISEETAEEIVQHEEVVEEKPEDVQKEDVVVKKGTKKKEKIRYTEEECKTMLESACREAGHILTQSEVVALNSKGKLPSWRTLNDKVGPWYTWSDMFGISFGDEKREQAAEKKKLEDEASRQQEAQEHPDEETTPTPSPPEQTEDDRGEEEKDIVEAVTNLSEEEIDDILEVVSGSDSTISQAEIDTLTSALDNAENAKSTEDTETAQPEESQTDASNDAEGPETLSEDDAPDDDSVEEDNRETDDDLVEIPFKVILPKGIHGTFSFHFSV